MTVIAIGRQLGAGGLAVGQQVAEALGYAWFPSRAIIEEAMKHFQVVGQEIESLRERPPTFFESFSASQRLYRLFIEATVYKLAEQGRGVLLGQGAPFLLRNISHVVRVLLTAPLESRVRRVADLEGMSEGTATQRVRSSDNERRAYMDYFYHVDWLDSMPYHAIFNTGRLGIEAVPALIVEIARKPALTPTPTSLEDLRRIRIETELRARVRSQTLVNESEIAVEVRGQELILRGFVMNPQEAEAVAKVAQGIAGVAKVENHLTWRVVSG